MPVDPYSKIFREKPEIFFEDILGFTPWHKQLEIAYSIRDHVKTSVRSGHSTGKTYSIARIALWFLFAFPNSIVINTAPTTRQVKYQFWRYFRQAHKNAKAALGGKLLQTEYKIDENWYALGFSTKPSDGQSASDYFQGFHGENILIIVDEASGVHEKVFEAIDGCIASGVTVRLVYIGNPTRTEGEFHRSFTDPDFNKIRIASTDTPNYKKGKIIVPGLATKDWVEGMARKYGIDSDVYRVRVSGEPPRKSSDTWISIDRIESSINSDRKKELAEEVIGVDVARFGTDSSALVYRNGNYSRVLEKIQGQDTMQIAGLVARYLRNDYPNAVAHIDVIGVGGGVLDRLLEQPDIADRCFGVNVACASTDPAEYRNLRSEGWGLVKDWLVHAILEDGEDWYQLAKPKYKIASGGQIQIESKQDMKKRGIPSPDVADALILTLLQPTEGGDYAVVSLL